MATFSRTVTVDWAGSIMEGKGSAKAGTGAFTLPVTFPSRIGEPAGTDQPGGIDGGVACGLLRDGVERDARAQERQRGAHAGHRNGHRRQDGGGHQAAVVEAEGRRPKGCRASRSRSSRKSRSEAEGKCPISNALRGTMDIEVSTADVK